MDGRVLVVDDDQDTCDLLQSSLERSGYRVTAKTSARDALEAFSQNEFDVVVTDLGMTEMNGLDLCERILGTQCDVPVIVITGQASLEAAVLAMRAGLIAMEAIDGRRAF